MILNVDVCWPVTSTGSIPIHHQYQLLSAVCRVLPVVHCSEEFGIHAIRGRRLSPGRLSLLRQSALIIRTKADKLPALMLLSGKKLDIAGCPIRLGVPRVLPLAPSRSLGSDLVTIKGYMEEKEFAVALRRQLDALDISSSVTLEISARRILRVKQQVIIGFKVCLDLLSDGESLLIQEIGLGGRRRLGCGLFNALRRTSGHK